MNVLHRQFFMLMTGFAIVIALCVPFIRYDAYSSFLSDLDDAVARTGIRFSLLFESRGMVSGSASPPSAATTMRNRSYTLQSLPTGKIAIAAPQSMRVKDEAIVQTNVGININLEELKKFIPANSQFNTGVLRVATEMSATLDGSKFAIAAKDPETQSIADGFPAVWRWGVTALEPGMHSLTATLYAHIPDDGKLTKVRIDSYSQKIDVLVQDLSWTAWLLSFAPNFEAVKTIVGAIGAIAAAGLGLVGFLFNRRRRTKQSDDGADNVIAT